MMAPGLMTWILTDQDKEFHGQGQDQVPPLPPRQPHDTYTPPVGNFIGPTDAPIVKLFQPMYFPCLPIQ